jgi:hypothetical protein
MLGPLPGGSWVALRGLQAAADRVAEAVRATQQSGADAGDVTIALTESVMWISALDQHARDVVQFPGYDQRRSTEPEGRAVGRLCYARNFQIHELVVTAQEATKQVRPGERGDPPAGVLAHLPGMARRADAVGERRLIEPIEAAIAWLAGFSWPLRTCADRRLFT